MNILAQKIGNDYYLLLQSRNKQEVVEKYYSFYNWKATNGEIQWLNEGTNGFYSGYIICDEERLAKYYFDSSINILTHDKNNLTKYKGKKGSGQGFKNEAKNLAKIRFGELIFEDFMPKYTHRYY